MLPVKVLLFEKADPSLVSIKVELTGNTPQKIHFPFFLESQILASYMYVLNYKSTAARPILLKFGQIVAR